MRKIGYTAIVEFAEDMRQILTLGGDTYFASIDAAENAIRRFTAKEKVRKFTGTVQQSWGNQKTVKVVKPEGK